MDAENRRAATGKPSNNTSNKLPVVQSANLASEPSNQQFNGNRQINIKSAARYVDDWPLSRQRQSVGQLNVIASVWQRVCVRAPVLPPIAATAWRHMHLTCHSEVRCESGAE